MPIMSIYDAENSEWREIPSLKGRPASIEVGKVTTLADNDFAYVKNTGTKREAVLDFGIPRGASGITPVRGIDFWTSADQEQIIKDVSDKLNLQFTQLMNAIQNKPSTFVLENKAELDSLLDLNNDTITYNNEEIKLNPGDMFLLKSLDEPDYWFGLDMNGEKLHELEARKIDLTDYMKTNSIQLISYADYEDLVSSGSVNEEIFYYVYEG